MPSRRCVSLLAGSTALSIAYNSAYAATTKAALHTSPLTVEGWRLAPAGDVNLATYGDGSASYFGPDGNSATFNANGTTTLTQPPGLAATLTHPAGANWTLTDHGSGQVSTFGPNGGPILSQADRNGNIITYTYPNGQNGPTTFTGTRDGGNPITLTYGGTCPGTNLCSASQTVDGIAHSFAFTYNTGPDTLAMVTEQPAVTRPWQSPPTGSPSSATTAPMT